MSDNLGYDAQLAGSYKIGKSLSVNSSALVSTSSSANLFFQMRQSCSAQQEWGELWNIPVWFFHRHLGTERSVGVGDTG